MIWNKEDLQYLYNSQGKTLEEIGKEKGVTRERVRQCMEFYNIPRCKNKPHNVPPRYKSLEDYFSHSKCVGEYQNKVIHRFIPGNSKCSECGSFQHIHVHHITYPAKSINDIQILCSSCHKLKHNNKMTLVKQFDLFNNYKLGETYIRLSRKYNISLFLVALIIRKFKNNWHTLRG